MLIPILTIFLGLVIGLIVYPFVADPVRDLMAECFVAAKVENTVKKKVTKEAPTEVSYMPVEKVMTMLKRRYDEAVVVVLADESYDDQHKLTIVKVVEVWKGPVKLIGKTMNQPLQAPMSYLHDKGTVRVLKFMLMTPHVNSSTAVAIREGMLGMNPTIKVETLKESLTGNTIEAEVAMSDIQ